MQGVELFESFTIFDTKCQVLLLKAEQKSDRHWVAWKTLRRDGFVLQMHSWMMLYLHVFTANANRTDTHFLWSLCSEMWKIVFADWRDMKRHWFQLEPLALSWCPGLNASSLVSPACFSNEFALCFAAGSSTFLTSSAKNLLFRTVSLTKMCTLDHFGTLCNCYDIHLLSCHAFFQANSMEGKQVEVQAGTSQWCSSGLVPDCGNITKQFPKKLLERTSLGRAMCSFVLQIHHTLVRSISNVRSERGLSCCSNSPRRHMLSADNMKNKLHRLPGAIFGAGTAFHARRDVAYARAGFGVSVALAPQWWIILMQSFFICWSISIIFFLSILINFDQFYVMFWLWMLWLWHFDGCQLRSLETSCQPHFQELSSGCFQIQRVLCRAEGSSCLEILVPNQSQSRHGNPSVVGLQTRSRTCILPFWRM